MKIDVVTLFPEIVDFPLSKSIMGRARLNGLLKIGFVNPRDFASDRHKTVDEKPYGGGSGMLLMAEPFYKAVQKVKKKSSHTVLLTPRGRVFNQRISEELSLKKHLILVCGHYEGIDERISCCIDDEISIGDFILSGGEPAAVCIIDSISRLLDGVIKRESREEESFSEYLLEFPQYTKPRVWKKQSVPDVLLSGDHKKVEEWRMERAMEITRTRRPDLYKEYLKSKKLNR
ncbi:MAG: tRNA (guanosine(37)-N1)-methyltransferase TrmD [Elusimicrobia bacterium]|nr:tRNA (guanosine(37)-N1)-methyltransferase TrmD [Elusimicrobiota bacterium]